MNLCDINEVKQLLERHGFKFSKSMGQNFLVEGWVPRDIADASGTDESCGVLEIGPGIGCLTSKLSERAGEVVSVELDRTLLPILKETLSECENVKIVSGDIMKTDIAALVSENFTKERLKVCANLPYNITTAVLSRFIEAKCFESITVMIQLEVAKRICAAPGTSDFGAFSLFMQYYTEPELLFEVPHDCFIPRPKVTSAVINCRVRTAPPVEVEDEDFFFRVIHSAFALRRKTLLNCLNSAFGELGKERLAEIIEECQLPPSIRGERLGLEEYARLSTVLKASLANQTK